MRIKGKTKAMRVGGALLTVLVLAMITGFQPLYWLLYLAVGGALVGYLWAWLQSRGLETHVQEISPHPQVGETVHLKVTVRERIGMPRLGLRARLVGEFATVGEEDFSLPPRGTATWTRSGPCRRRGLNTIGSLAMVSSDPSGLFRVECRFGRPQSILVYPATVELSRAVVPGQATGGEIVEAGQFIGHIPVVSNVCEYIPGDSLTRIHWPTTARLDQLMTKEFEGAGINEIWLFVDLQEAVQAGTGDDGTEECSITIAASLAKNLIQDGHAVGLVMEGDELYRFAPGSDSQHLWALLKALAMARAKGRTPLSTLMTQQGGNLGPGTVAIVVAPWYSRSTGSLLQFLVRRGILVVPIFLDTATFGRLPDSRPLAEAQVEIQEWALVVKRGDELSTPLGNVLDLIASY